MTCRDVFGWVLIVTGGGILGLPAALNAAWDSEVQRHGFADASPFSGLSTYTTLIGAALALTGLALLLVPAFRRKPA